MRPATRALATLLPAGCLLVAGCTLMDLFDEPVVDESCAKTYYRDDDGDTFGRDDDTKLSCEPVQGYVDRAGDCDDTDPEVFPGAPERCNDIDDDCNPSTNPHDADGDGFDDASCGGSDCDDDDDSVYPGAPEPCDGVDHDCAGDEEDVDGDGHVAPDAACEGGPFAKDDCDDEDPAIHPGVVEECNGIDDDCDGATDEGATDVCTLPGATVECRERGCTVLSCDEQPCGDWLAAGPMHTCALVGGGRIACWGENVVGQLGAGGFMERGPVLVEGIDDAVQLAAGGSVEGDSYTCAVREDGTVWCWGNMPGVEPDGCRAIEGSPTQVHELDDAVEVAAGLIHACARREAGEVVCWGSSGAEVLGPNADEDCHVEPIPVGISNATHLVAGQLATCARTAEGELRCWGNHGATLGDGSTYVSAEPVLVATDIARADFSASHNCFVRASGTVACWGDNEDGQLGLGASSETPETTPVDTDLTDGIDVGVGIDDGPFSCALQSGGDVSCWGDLTPPGASASPAPVADVEGALVLAVGGAHACARVQSRILCWGANDSGQLGDGTTEARSDLVPVMLPE